MVQLRRLTALVVVLAQTSCVHFNVKVNQTAPEPPKAETVADYNSMAAYRFPEKPDFSQIAIGDHEAEIKALIKYSNQLHAELESMVQNYDCRMRR